MTKISQLSSIGDSLAVGDQFLIRDIDDAGSPNKSVTVSGITRALDLGTAAAPAIAFATDKNSGIFSPGADQVAISTNGTGRLFVTSLGRVGVNTDSPAFIFQIQHTTEDGIRLRTANTSDSHIDFADTDANGRGRINYDHATDSMGFRTAGAERMRLTSAGLLGLGTSSPGGRLELNTAVVDNSTNYTETIWNPYAFRVNQGNVSIFSSGGASSAGDSYQLSFYGRYFNTGQNYQTNKGGYIRGGVVNGASLGGQPSGEGILYIGTSTTNYGTLGVSDSDTVVVRNNRVGIGTTAPTQLVTIRGANFTGSSFNGQAIEDPNAERIRIGYKDGSLDTGLVPAQIVQVNASELAIASRDVSTSAIRFHTGTGVPERARIDSSGRLLVGTSTSTGSAGGTANLQVAGSARLTNGLASTIDVASIALNATTAITLPKNGLYCIFIDGMNLSGIFFATLSGGGTGVRMVFSTNATDIVGGLTTEPAGGNYLRLWISGGQLQIKNVNAFVTPYYITPLVTGA